MTATADAAAPGPSPTGAWERFRHFREKNHLAFEVAFFFAGFLFDYLLLHRIDSRPLLIHQGSYLVLQPWEYARIPALKAKNPNLKILMYKDVSATRKDVEWATGIASTGVTYQEAAANNWLLTDAARARSPS
ncbi:MAG TPA: hypothetical protein PLU79_02460 [Burkholderiaceae bacterium]|nr:hypothetical protein [Burkholderiaceae bacterium]